MAMVSMKMDEMGMNSPMPDENPYGYGLCINLSEEQCETLGITTPPAAGTRMKMTAMVYVASSTSSVEDGDDSDGPDCRMTLQITDMELGGTGQEKPASTVLYGDGGNHGDQS